MIILVEVPDHFARQHHLDGPTGGRKLFEAFLLQRYAKAELSADQIGEVLGLSFYETEQFLRAHGHLV